MKDRHEPEAGTAAFSQADRETRTPPVVVGLSGARQNAAVAVCVDGQVRAACEFERITRVRRAGMNGGTLDAVLEVVLRNAGGWLRRDVWRYATGEDAVTLPADRTHVRLEHHQTHAMTAFALSPYASAAILVCDGHSPESMSVWTGTREGASRVDWPVSSTGFARWYSECCELFGLPDGSEHELEAIARLDRGTQADRFAPLLKYNNGVIDASPDWMAIVADWVAQRPADVPWRAAIASAFQRHLGDLLLALTADVRRATGQPHLCLGGGLFYNTYFSTLIRQSDLFDDVFVAPNPGNAGTALGAALVAADAESRPRHETI